MALKESALPSIAGDIILADIHKYKTEAHFDMHRRWLKHGMTEAQFAQIHGASPAVQLGLMLHDIGKADSTLDPRVWNLPEGKLSEDDFSAMKEHAGVGVEILRSFHKKTGQKIPKDTYDIVQYHHEKLDGSGPFKKKGKEISEAVRLAVIIDQILSRCEYRLYRNTNRLTYTLREAFDEVNKGRDTLYDGKILDKVKYTLDKKLHWQLPLRKMALSFAVDGVLEDRGFYLQVGTMKKRIASFLHWKKGSIVGDFPIQKEIPDVRTTPDVDPLSLLESFKLWYHSTRGFFPDALAEFPNLGQLRRGEIADLDEVELMVDTGRPNQWDFRHMTEKKHAMAGILYDSKSFKPKDKSSAEGKHQAIDRYLYDNPDFFLIHYEDDPYTAFYVASLARKYPGRVFVVLIDRDPRIVRLHYKASDLEKFENMSVEPNLTAAFDTLSMAGFRPYNKKDLMEMWNPENSVSSTWQVE